MTRKDYIKIAAAIEDVDTTHHEKWVFSNALADILKEDNPAFDRERFLAACGLRKTSSI
jgi:hypothetical protein